MKPSDDTIKNGTHCRSPCPALNILANHSYIDNDGKNLTIDKITNAVNEVFGVSKSITKLGLYITKYRCKLKENFTLADISIHNGMEHDVSLFHDDVSKNPKYHQVSTKAVDDFIDIANQQDANKFFTKETIENHYNNRLAISKKTESFYYGWFQLFVSFFERYLLYNVLVKSHKIEDLKTIILEEKLPDDHINVN